MSLIDSKYREAANVLANADDEVLQTAGMIALMRLETLDRRMKGFTNEKAITPANVAVCFPKGAPPPFPTSTSNPISSGFKFGMNPDSLTKPPQSFFTAPSTGFVHPSKLNHGGTGFLFGSPSKTTVPFSNSEVSGSQGGFGAEISQNLQSFPATGNSGNAAAETRVFGDVQSGVPFGQSEANSLVAKPEEKHTIQTKEVPEVSELTKLTQEIEENSKVLQSI